MAYTKGMQEEQIVFNQTVGAWLVQNAWLLVVIAIWSSIWKGLALWRAARNGDNVWFVILLFVNTLGILEMSYLAYFGKKARSKSSIES